jgi:hypothetical protein
MLASSIPGLGAERAKELLPGGNILKLEVKFPEGSPSLRYPSARRRSRGARARAAAGGGSPIRPPEREERDETREAAQQGAWTNRGFGMRLVA